MKISLRLFGILRTEIGFRQIDLELDLKKLTVGDLPAILEEKYGKKILSLLKNTEDSFDHLRILINGQDHSILGGMESEIKDGDVVSLLPPLSGG
jgi:molybdopterin synthase sulfur carrier subunit